MEYTLNQVSVNDKAAVDEERKRAYEEKKQRRQLQIKAEKEQQNLILQ